MVSDGLRLALMVAAPIVGAVLAHELRRRLPPWLVGGLAVALSVGLAVSLIGSVGSGGSVERSFGLAVAGVDLTLRADSASVAAVLIAAVACLLALTRLRQPEAVAGLLLCLAGTAAVATSGNLVIVVAGVTLAGGGTLLLQGRRGPGSRSSVALVCVLGAAALALLAAAAQLVAGAGSSDPVFVPQGAVGNAVAMPWAMAGAALLLAPGLISGASAAARDWAAAGVVPSGFLVLLRLQQSTGGQVPGGAAVLVAGVGAAAAVLAAVVALRARTLATVGRGATGVVSGVLVSLFGSPLADVGVVLAGLFLAVEVALMAAPGWARRPSAGPVVAVAATALPGGFAVAVAVTGLGVLAQRGPGAFPQLLLLSGALTGAAIAGARSLATAPAAWRPFVPGVALAAAAGLVGGLVPGIALRAVAGSLSAGGARVDLDAGSLAAAGGGFAAGYFAIAAAIVAGAAAAAFVVASDHPLAVTSPDVRAIRPPAIRQLLRLRRGAAPGIGTAGALVRRVDHWLEAQPQLPLVVAAAVLGILLIR